MRRHIKRIVKVNLLICVRFAAVGFVGFFVQILLCNLIENALNISFGWANSLSVFISTCCIYFINNELYGHLKHSKIDMWRGLFRFLSTSMIGITLNMSTAIVLYSIIKLEFISQISGILIGYIFTIVITRRLTWNN